MLFLFDRPDEFRWNRLENFVVFFSALYLFSWTVSVCRDRVFSFLFCHCWSESRTIKFVTRVFLCCSFLIRKEKTTSSNRMKRRKERFRHFFHRRLCSFLSHYTSLGLFSDHRMIFFLFSCVKHEKQRKKSKRIEKNLSLILLMMMLMVFHQSLFLILLQKREREREMGEEKIKDMLCLGASVVFRTLTAKDKGKNAFVEQTERERENEKNVSLACQWRNIFSSLLFRIIDLQRRKRTTNDDDDRNEVDHSCSVDNRR